MIRSMTRRDASMRARAALASATCSVARAIADTSASDSLCPLTSIENSRQKASEQKAEKRKRLLSDCQLHCAYCLLLTAYCLLRSSVGEFSRSSGPGVLAAGAWPVRQFGRMNAPVSSLSHINLLKIARRAAQALTRALGPTH